MNRDPIGEEGGENLYEFCRNTPTFCFDLFGQEIYYFINQQYLDQTEQEYGISGKSGPDSFENVSIISKVDNLNFATEKTGQPEFHITYKKFDSLSSLIKLTETSSSSDHIIVHTHGAPSGIFFGDTVTIYNSEEMKCFIEALKNHAQTLTLRVCHVSSENAEAIKKDAELKSIYYSSTENQMRIGDFGLWPVWDPADTFRILRYEYSPEKSGLQKKQ